MLTFKDVDKSYGKVKANRNINLNFESGKIYGVLGRDYSGKSTLLKLAAGQIKPSNGQVTLDGNRIYENSKTVENISLAREEGIGIDDLKVQKMIDMASVSYKNWDDDFKNLLVEEFELDTNKRYYKLSKEEQSLVGIIIGLASRAEWTLFDDLSADLGKRNIMKFCEILKMDHMHNPRTVIISNRDIDETADLFDHIIVMRDGKIIIDEPMEIVKSKLRYVSGESSKIEDIEAYKQTIFKSSFGDTVVLGIYDDLDEDLKIAYKARGITISEMPIDRGYKYFTEDSIERDKEEIGEVELKMDYTPKAPEPLESEKVVLVDSTEKVIEMNDEAEEPVLKAEAPLAEKVIKSDDVPEELEPLETEKVFKVDKEDLQADDSADTENAGNMDKTDRLLISAIDKKAAESNKRKGGDTSEQSE